MDNLQNQEKPQKAKGYFSYSKLIIFFLVVFAVVATSAIFILLKANNSFGGNGAKVDTVTQTGARSVLNPKGPIAKQERNIIVAALVLMLLVVIPTFIVTFLIVWKYRAGNGKSNYTPNWDRNFAVTFLLWAIPTTVIFIIAIIVWRTTHELDPYKALNSNVKPLTIQVVSLQWKWLFIYPEQNIATVNFIEFPEGTPVNFELTADSPMSTFWIPQLGGQVYAMAGMNTQIHLLADQPGEFPGSSSEINGRGYAGMKFIAKSASQADFDTWIQSVKSSSSQLNLGVYNKLAEPSENNPRAFYSSVGKDLYNSIMMKFMMPVLKGNDSMSNMEGMQ